MDTQVSPQKMNPRGSVIELKQKTMIVNHYKYLREKYDNRREGEYGVDENVSTDFSFNEASHEISDVMGIGHSSIFRILQEYVHHKTVSPPKKTRKKLDTFAKLDEFTKDAIRKKVRCA